MSSTLEGPEMLTGKLNGLMSCDPLVVAAERLNEGLFEPRDGLRSAGSGIPR